jgi:hypothetical protein
LILRPNSESGAQGSRSLPEQITQASELLSEAAKKISDVLEGTRDENGRFSGSKDA